jgi:uncharacterized protein (TIGR00255 family)
MTGFGEAQGALSERWLAEVRLSSVNGRFLELQIRTQPRFDTADLEPAIRAVLAEQLQRGRVTVAITMQRGAGQAAGMGWHWELLEELQRELARRPAGIELAPLSLRDLLALPGFANDATDRIDQQERVALLQLVAQARDALVAARAQEGAALQTALAADFGVLAEFGGWLESVNRAVRETLLERLRARLAEVLPPGAVAEDRLLVEAAIAADRADVSEEVQRIASHLQQARRLLADGGAVGKRLEFLLQELLREVNTAASKCREVGVGERVVEAKAALERLREQVANLE